MKSVTRLILAGFLVIGGWALLPRASFALTVSPPVTELAGQPGETIGGLIRVYNETGADISVTPSLNTFRAKEGEGGEPEIIEDVDGEIDSLPQWISLPVEAFTVRSLDWQNIYFQVQIPRDAEPGGHYAAIFFSPRPADQVASQAVSVDYKTGVLVLLTVAGDVREAGNIESFRAQDDRSWFENVPVTYELRVRNSGSVHFRPTGTLTVTNLFGGKSAEIAVVKGSSGGNVLPESIRRYEVVWGEAFAGGGFWETVKHQKRNFHLGPYFARAAAALPAGQTAETESVVVLMFPWQLLLVALIGLLGLFFLFRAYNRWIIRQARKKE